MEAAVLQSSLCSFPLSIISRYLANRNRRVSFRTTLRMQLIPAEHEVGQIVAATRMAPAPSHTLVSHQNLQETQSFERQADGIQTDLSNPAQRGERTALPTGTTIQIQQRDKGSGSQIISQNVSANKIIAPFPAESEVVVGGVDETVLLLDKVVGCALEKVSLDPQLPDRPLDCGSAALAEPGQISRGNGHISAFCLPKAAGERLPAWWCGTRAVSVIRLLGSAGQVVVHRQCHERRIRLKHCSLSTIPKKGAQTQAP